ncbi:MAG: hypothetical protein R3C11_09085 [Planctomycetaceae bacterium]
MHNQYLEALVDAGIPGLALMLLMIVLSIYACWKLFNTEYFYTFIVAVMGGLILFFQAFHAAVDYCLYLPATMVLFAAIVGAMVGRAVRSLESSRNLLVALPYTSWSWPVLLAVLLGGSLWSYNQLSSLHEMELAIKSYPVDTDLSKVEARTIRVIISQLEDALKKRPEDAQGQEALGEYYLSLYRLEARDTLAEELKVSVEDRNLWLWTSPVILSDVALKAFKNKDAEELKNIREQETVVEFLNPALEHLKLSLEACPLLSNVHFRIQQIGFLDENWTFADAHLKRAEQTGSWNADLMYVAGQTRFARGERDQAIEDWQQSLRVDARHIDDILRICKPWMTPQQVLDKLVPQKPDILIQIAEPCTEPRRQKKLRNSSSIRSPVYSMNRNGLLEPASFITHAWPHCRGTRIKRWSYSKRLIC